MSNASGTDKFDVFFAKYNSDGIPIWAKSVGTSGRDYGNCISASNNNEIFVTGSFEAPSIDFDKYTLTNLGNWNIFTAKLATPSGIKENSLFSMLVYPNPISKEVTIKLSQYSKNITVKIYDVLGKEMKSCVVNGVEFTLNNLELINTGVYILQVSDENGNSTQQKIIISQ